MLPDRLVCGANDERIQRRLLAESQLEFKKAMELATAMETADKNTRDLQNGNPSTHENLASVASVSVGFGSKEILRNGVSVFCLCGKWGESQKKRTV